MKRILRAWPWLLLVMLVTGTLLPFGTANEFPARLVLGPEFSRSADQVVDWMVTNWGNYFSAVNQALLQYLLLPLEGWLLSLPWWPVAVVVGLSAYRFVGPLFSVVALLMVMVLAVFGLFDLAMTTLAIVITAATLSVTVGVPAGILMAKSNRADAVLRPLLDMMQTMPSFVYLIPVLMLFGLGKVPAVIAVVIYAVPPMIRLTNFGIRQVDPHTLEAAKAFGATALQLLFKVQLPLALPTIMAGLNQTMMMALSMVVVASMIGAKGLGTEVLNGIARLEIGRGLLGGIGIVIMAIILDRVTQGIARTRSSSRQVA